MKKLLSVFAALAVAVSLSGCQAGQADTVISETTQIEVTTQTEKDYSDYEKFPEGWSAERVLNMISIDGHQLSFPCTVDDILALSEDFEIEEYEKNDSEKMAYLYYKDVQVAVITYYNNHNINYVNFNDFFQHGHLYLEGINIQNSEKITELLKILLNSSDNYTLNDEDYTHIKKYYDKNNAIIISYSKSNVMIAFSWEEIK